MQKLCQAALPWLKRLLAAYRAARSARVSRIIRSGLAGAE